MIWHLLAVFIFGICAGSFAFLLIKISRNKLPKWLIPVFAGLGMFSYLAYYDYTWFDFKSGQLPEGTVVVEEKRHNNFFRPWSYVIPPVSAFVVLDGEVKETQLQGQTLVEYEQYEFINDYTERLETKRYVLNCTTAEQLQVQQPNSPKVTSKVEPVERDSALYKKLCWQ